MVIEDILYSCERIGGISSIPIRVYENGVLFKSFSLHDMPIDPIKPYEEMILKKEESVSYYLSPFHQYYGAIHHSAFHLLLGPIGQTEYTAQEKADYAFALGIQRTDFETLLKRMALIPVFPLENFLHMMLMINFYFNGEKKELNHIIAYLEPTQASSQIAPPLVEAEPVPFTPTVHNAMAYEKQMLSLIRQGDSESLQQFLMREIHGTAGNLSKEQLRNQKNIFVVSTTLVSRAAIEGGLPEEEALSMSDRFIRHSEELFNPEPLAKLQYQMVMDYAKAVHELVNEKPLTPLIASLVTYIHQHLSLPLSLESLSTHFHLSRNNLASKFKNEMGLTISQYIMNEKMRKAKWLLAYTDKSLEEIAEYLGFASQSHFQTRFKSDAGLTPMAYRKQP